jgi:hypothetical protein
LVFPSVALWLAWRSLQNYFAFMGVFALIGDESIVGDTVPALAAPDGVPAAAPSTGALRSG